jgi:four helix bundle protein
MSDFKKYAVWNESMDLVDSIYSLIDKLPQNERYGLRSQAARSAVSIPLNIAEGSSRTSAKDFKRFLEIALGSAFELETILLVIQRRNWDNVPDPESIIPKIVFIQKQLGWLIARVKEQSRKK